MASETRTDPTTPAPTPDGVEQRMRVLRLSIDNLFGISPEDGRWLLTQLDAARAALKLACQRIADSPQGYSEANTAEGWAEEFLRRATAGAWKNPPAFASGCPYLFASGSRACGRQEPGF